MRAQTCGNGLQCVARSDLRRAPLVDKSTRAEYRRGARFGAIGFQHIEPWLVDRFKRKLRLKPRLRGRVQLSGRSNRPVAIQARAVALETEEARWAGGAGGGGSMQPTHAQRGFPLERRAAGLAEHFGALALQLAAWEANPVVTNGLRIFLRHDSQCKRAL